MLLGASVVLWKTRALWALGFTIFAGGLCLLAVATPRAYAPFGRVLDGLQERTVRAFSWVVLGLVFALVFTPGRLLFALRGKHRGHRSTSGNTYWQTCGNDDPSDAFQRQF